MSDDLFDTYNTGWSQADWTLAFSEGWNIWHCDGSDNGEWQVCKYDEPDLFDGMPEWDEDTDVWAHVYERAARGSVTHQRALNYVKRWNPMEYDCIVKWVDSQAKVG